MLDNANTLALRQQASRHYATSWLGQNRMLELMEQDDFPEELIQPAAGSLAASWRPGIRKEAAKYLDAGAPGDESTPSINQLVGLEGDAETGGVVFEKYCQSCHVVNGNGVDFGPGLSEIGSKLSKEALYASILNPDAGISFGYEGYLVTLEDDTKVSGLIQSRTHDEITIKQIGGASSVYEMNQVKSIEQLDASMMTPNLHRLMNQQELVDLVTYLDKLESPV